MRNTAIKALAVGVALASGGVASTANANSNWDFRLAPMYLWAQSVEGESFIGPAGGDIELDFRDDVLDNLNTAATVHFEAVNDDLTYFFDINHVSLDPENEVNNVSASIDYEMNMAEIGATWAFSERKDYRRWEAMFGLRYIEQDIEVKADLNLPPPIGRTLKVNGGDEWYQPFLGIRVFQRLSQSWGMIGRFDYGYSNSDNKAANAQITFDWRFNNWGSLLLGYRHMEYDYAGGSGRDFFSADMKHRGPVIGLNIHW